MENRKLQLADICMYLPYGLKASVSEQFNTVDGTIKDEVICDICDIGLGSHNAGLYSCKLGNGIAHISNCKPILRPMSDLTKPMTHPDVNGGEEFVPLRFIANAMFDDDEYSQIDIHIVNFEDINGGGVMVVDLSYYSLVRQKVRFDTKWIPINISLINLLAKLHFDYNDLIGQGLAIDVNTLKKYENRN